MGNQQNQQKWYSFSEVSDIKVAAVAVFEGRVVETERPQFTDPKGRQKVFMEKTGSAENCLIFSKTFSPAYHEINLKFPKWARLGRQSESKPFDVRATDGKFGYCYLRVQPGMPFQSVYVAIDRKTYKLSVKEDADCIKVLLWVNPTGLPKCLLRR